MSFCLSLSFIHLAGILFAFFCRLRLPFFVWDNRGTPLLSNFFFWLMRYVHCLMIMWNTRLWYQDSRHCRVFSSLFCCWLISKCTKTVKLTKLCFVLNKENKTVEFPITAACRELTTIYVIRLTFDLKVIFLYGWEKSIF